MLVKRYNVTSLSHFVRQSASILNACVMNAAQAVPTRGSPKERRFETAVGGDFKSPFLDEEKQVFHIYTRRTRWPIRVVISQEIVSARSASSLAEIS
jgi:hypothetical protein